MLERPELLEPLGLLERRRGEARVALEERVAEHVDAHVPERPHQARLARIGHGRPREVERVARLVQDDLDRVRVPVLGLVRDRVREGAPADGPGDWLFAARPTQAEARPDDAPASGRLPRPFRFGELRVLGQLLGTYLLLETKEGLLLVDQHAAHERVLYEGLRAAWLADGVPRQPLLLPETLELEVPALAALAACGALVETLGFEVEPFGETAVLVRAVPALIAGRDPLGALRGLADQLRSAGEGAPTPASRLLDSADRWFASVACHSARRAGE